MNFNQTQKITHHLMVKSPLLGDMGLFEGKMGVLIAFYELGRKYDNEVYTAYGGELLDQIFADVHKQLSIDLSSGLSGIGWGIEYLIQNKYVDGDSLEVCEEIDLMIMKTDPRRITDFSFDKGWHGILHYILAHAKGCMMQGNKMPFDQMYISDIYHIMSRQLTQSEDADFKDTAGRFIRLCETNKLNYTPSLSTVYEKMEKGWKMEEIASLPLGIRKGLAANLLAKTR